MAVHTAAHLQDRVEALVTVSAQAFVEDRTLDGIRTAKAGFADPEAFARLTRHHGDKAGWVLNAWTETWLSPSFSNWSLDDGLDKVRCRTLAIHGDQDEFGSIRHPERIAERTGGRAMILADTGHTPHRECPQVLVETIRDFLDGQA
jgi:pimeloyl-ACP methyl ester carboxylesterase